MKKINYRVLIIMMSIINYGCGNEQMKINIKVKLIK